MDWPMVRVETWEHFANEIDQLVNPNLPRNLGFVFRGQANSVWNLSPSLARLCNRQPIKDVFRLEGELRQEFQAHGAGHVPHHYFTFGNEVQGWWCLMQHYRAPTRLLDWSDSPYVATYFAVEDHWDKDGVVWVFDGISLRIQIQKQFGDRDPATFTFDDWCRQSDGLPLITCFRRLGTTDRMTAQQGVFTVSVDPIADHAEVVSAHLMSLPGPPRFRRIQIPAVLKPSFLRRLRTMNISANSLFPGIDGVGRSMAELVRLRMSPPVIRPGYPIGPPIGVQSYMVGPPPVAPALEADGSEAQDDGAKKREETGQDPNHFGT